MSAAENGWAEVRVGDLGSILTGRTPPSERPSCFGEVYPFITPGDMHQGKFARKTERSLSHEGANLLSRIKLPANSVCVSCIGWQMGEVIITDRVSFSNQQINVIIPREPYDPSYLYYSFRLRKQELLSLGSAAGARTPILNKSAFSNLKIRIPSLPTQRRIASVLGAYDDLIEVNRRRITLLEEMARRLFEEWFVHFRFPGHELVKIIDGVPEGWRRFALSELAEFLNGYPFKPCELGNEGMPIVKIPELKSGVTHRTPRNTGETIPTKYHLKNGDLIFSWSGTLAANVWASGPALLNQHLFLVRPTEPVSAAFTMLALRNAIAEFDSHSVGATMKHIRRSALDRVFIALPDRPMMAKVDAAFSLIYREVTIIRQQNQKLAASRDLLLPRLISGELSVVAAECELEAVA